MLSDMVTISVLGWGSYLLLAVVASYEYPWLVALTSTFEARKSNNSEAVFLSWICSGSFIDIYGTVLTAGHCVPEKAPWEINNTIQGTRKLLRVQVTYRVAEKRSVKDKTEPVIDLSRISRYKPGTVNPALARFYNRSGTKGQEVDIALIHLTALRKSPMRCSSGSMPQPIKLSKGGEGKWKKPAIFAVSQLKGVGNFTLHEASMAVPMKYDFHVNPFIRCEDPRTYRAKKRLLLFQAHVATYNVHQKLKNSSKCKGNSGGPYMIDEKKNGVLKQVGVMVLGACSNEEPCIKVNKTNSFVDVSHKDVRKWIRRELKKRYTVRQRMGPVPKTC